jgi:hypothetical protein
MNVVGISDGPVSGSANSTSDSGVIDDKSAYKADFGVWNKNTIKTDSAHEFGHLMNIDDRTTGNDMMNTNILLSATISRQPTANDFNWAFGAVVGQHREESRQNPSILGSGFPFKKGNPQSHSSSRIVRLQKLGKRF